MFQGSFISRHLSFVFIVTNLYSAYANEFINQVYLMLFFSLAVGCISSHFYKKRDLDHVLSRIIIASLTSSCVYIFCVYLGNQSENNILDRRFLDIYAKYLFGPSIFLLSYLTNWHAKNVCGGFLKTLIAANLLLLLLRCYFGIYTGFVIGNMHSNYIGLFAALSFGVAFLIANNNYVSLAHVKILAILSFTLVILSLSRGSLLSLITGIGAYAIFGRYSKSILFSFLLSISLVATIIFSTFHYDTWLSSDKSLWVRDIVENVTTKPLDTGRAKHWKVAINEITESPWLGSGFDSRSSWDRKLANGKTITISVHNYYLAIIHEAGFIGLFITLALLVTVLTTIISDVKYSQINAAIFLAILVHQATETSLTTGNYTMGALFWYTWGIGARLSSGQYSSNISTKNTE